MFLTLKPKKIEYYHIPHTIKRNSYGKQALRGQKTETFINEINSLLDTMAPSKLKKNETSKLRCIR
jgi:hypothetical protein